MGLLLYWRSRFEEWWKRTRICGESEVSGEGGGERRARNSRPNGTVSRGSQIVDDKVVERDTIGAGTDPILPEDETMRAVRDSLDPAKRIISRVLLPATARLTSTEDGSKKACCTFP